MPQLLWYICFTAILVSLFMVMAPTTFMGRNGSRSAALAILLLASTTSLMATFTTQLVTTGDVPRILTMSTADLVSRRDRENGVWSITVTAPASGQHRFPALMARHIHTASIAN